MEEKLKEIYTALLSDIQNKLESGECGYQILKEARELLKDSGYINGISNPATGDAADQLCAVLDQTDEELGDELEEGYLTMPIEMIANK